jgi:hypothetical protein
MADYYINSIERREDHSVSVFIIGPGIKRPGARYWFRTTEEAHSLVENLNLSYWNSKLLSAIRMRLTQKKTAKSYAAAGA